MVRKSAFTLIELLFAIVIIGISVISLPMINLVVVKGISANITQEAVFAAATKLNEATTAHWDENSFEVGETNTLARVIDIPENTFRCDNNSSADTYRQMIGHINQPLHRRCLDSNTTSFSNIDVAGVISLGDKINGSQNIFVDSVPNNKGYKQKYNSTIAITHPANFDGTNNNNIKQITVTILDSDDKPITRLHTFSMNIGEVDYLKKEY